MSSKLAPNSQNHLDPFNSRVKWLTWLHELPIQHIDCEMVVNGGGLVSGRSMLLIGILDQSKLDKIAEDYNEANPSFGGSIKSHHHTNVSICLDQIMPKRGMTIRLTVDHLKCVYFDGRVDGYGYLLVYRWRLQPKIIHNVNETCPVCLETFNQMIELHEVPIESSKHLVCSDCYNKGIYQCPLCRKDIGRSDDTTKPAPINTNIAWGLRLCPRITM